MWFWAFRQFFWFDDLVKHTKSKTSTMAAALWDYYCIHGAFWPLVCSLILGLCVDLCRNSLIWETQTKTITSPKTNSSMSIFSLQYFVKRHFYKSLNFHMTNYHIPLSRWIRSRHIQTKSLCVCSPSPRQISIIFGHVWGQPTLWTDASRQFI